MFEVDKVLEFKALCGSARRISIVVHTRPDGDALGCGTGLCTFLAEVMHLDAMLVIPDSIPDFLGFAACPARMIDASCDMDAAAGRIGSSDLLIVMDMNAFSRAGALEPELARSGARKVLIDHHLNPDRGSFDMIFSDTQVSSASELTYWLLSDMPLPHSVLRPLLAGMTTDTNNFANSVWPSTLRMASEILAAGVDRDEILSYLYNEYRENRLRAMGYVLSEKMTITPDGVAYMVLRRGDMARFDLRDGETEGFVNMPLSVGNVRMSLLLKEDNGYFRVSIRSKKGVSANAYARECFNGGGHENASGGRLYFPGDIDGPADAEKYIETTSARFMKRESAVK